MKNLYFGFNYVTNTTFTPAENLKSERLLETSKIWCRQNFMQK